MSKFCASCGAMLSKGAKFCRQCGAPVQAAAAPASQPEIPRPSAAPVRPPVRPDAGPVKQPAKPVQPELTKPAEKNHKKPINKLTLTIVIVAAVVILACILIFTGGQDSARGGAPAADNYQPADTAPSSPGSEESSPESSAPSSNDQSAAPAPGTADSEISTPEDPAEGAAEIIESDELVEWLQGYWVNLDSAYNMYDSECSFETVYFEGTKEYYVYHPGGIDPPGDISAVSHVDGNHYILHIYRGADTTHSGDTYDEASYDAGITIENGNPRTITFDASSDLTWTYMGASLEEANENVYLYLTSPQPSQSTENVSAELFPHENWNQMNEREKLFEAARPLVDAISDSTDDPKSHVGFLDSILDDVKTNGLKEEPTPVVMVIDDTFIEHLGIAPYVISREDYITIIMKDTNAGESFQWDFNWQYELLSSPGFTIQEFLAESGVL